MHRGLGSQDVEADLVELRDVKTIALAAERDDFLSDCKRSTKLQQRASEKVSLERENAKLLLEIGGVRTALGLAYKNTKLA